MDELGMGGFFEKIIVSARIGYEKPHSAIYETALEIAQNPQIRYMIGDNPVADVQGAMDAGIPAILVHRDAVCPAVFKSDTLCAIPGFLSTHG